MDWRSGGAVGPRACAASGAPMRRASCASLSHDSGRKRDGQRAGAGQHRVYHNERLACDVRLALHCAVATERQCLLKGLAPSPSLDTAKVTHLFSTHAQAWWRNYVTPRQ